MLGIALFFLILCLIVVFAAWVDTGETSGKSGDSSGGWTGGGGDG